MGLDMMLYKEVSQEPVEIGYWRKVNAIHGWIVNNLADGVDECQRIPMTADNMRELLGLCKRVMKTKSRKTAQAILPTTPGFFFGGDDYDEWYFRGIEHTIKILEEALEEPNGTFFYRASW